MRLATYNVKRGSPSSSSSTMSSRRARSATRSAATGAQVLDRTGVIVEIFHRHANTREAELQVEMTRRKHLAPRMRESSAGGAGRLHQMRASPP